MFILQSGIRRIVSTYVGRRIEVMLVLQGVLGIGTIPVALSNTGLTNKKKFPLARSPPSAVLDNACNWVLGE